MYAVEPAHWTPRACAVWQRIAAFPFERPDKGIDFTRRLARDRGWSLAYARGAIDAYRRFCFLAVTCGVPVTPSEEVDEVWHQHLTYSRDYWDRWCARTLGTSLHHDPTEGGPGAGARHRAQYAETLALHEAWFGLADPAYWPATHRRFRAQLRFRVVDRDHALVVPWRRWVDGLAARIGARLGLAAILLLQTTWPGLAATPTQLLNPFDWPAPLFLVLYAALCLASLAAVFALSPLKRSIEWLWNPYDIHVDTVRIAASEANLLHLAWLAGGRQRVAATVLAGLVDAGTARIHTPRGLGALIDTPEIEIGRAPVPEPFTAFGTVALGRYSYDRFVGQLGTALEAIEADLVRRGLKIDPTQTDGTYNRMFAIVTLTATFGLIRVVIGFGRDKPIGYTVALILVTVVLGLWIAGAAPMRTPLGSAVLEQCRTWYRRAASAPRSHELLFAFALGGAAVLEGTHLAEVGTLFQSQGGGGAGDGGSGCGGGSGGDGGGGGCGGCGGGGD